MKIFEVLNNILFELLGLLIVSVLVAIPAVALVALMRFMLKLLGVI